jgi:hypothetical protein
MGSNLLESWRKRIAVLAMALAVLFAFGSTSTPHTPSSATFVSSADCGKSIPGVPHSGSHADHCCILGCGGLSFVGFLAVIAEIIAERESGATVLVSTRETPPSSFIRFRFAARGPPDQA